MSKTWIVALLVGALGIGGYALAGPGDSFEPAPPPGPPEYFPPDIGAPPPPGGARMRRMDAMSERVLEREAEILEQVKSASPERFERLMWLKREHPELYSAALRKTARMVEIEATDPEAAKRLERMHELRTSLHAKAAGFDKLSEKEQKARRAEMVGLANELFDLRQQELQGRLDAAAKKLEEAKARLKKRDLERDKIISEHLDRLIYGPPEEL